MDDLSSFGYDFEETGGATDSTFELECQKWEKAQARAVAEHKHNMNVIKYSGIYLLKGQTGIHKRYQDKFMRLNIPTKIVGDYLFLITDIYLLTEEDMSHPDFPEKEIITLYRSYSQNMLVF